MIAGILRTLHLLKRLNATFMRAVEFHPIFLIPLILVYIALTALCGITLILILLGIGKWFDTSVETLELPGLMVFVFLILPLVWGHYAVLSISSVLSTAALAGMGASAYVSYNS